MVLGHIKQHWNRNHQHYKRAGKRAANNLGWLYAAGMHVHKKRKLHHNKGNEKELFSKHGSYGVINEEMSFSKTNVAPLYRGLKYSSNDKGTCISGEFMFQKSFGSMFANSNQIAYFEAGLLCGTGANSGDPSFKWCGNSDLRYISRLAKNSPASSGNVINATGQVTAAQTTLQSGPNSLVPVAAGNFGYAPAIFEVMWVKSQFYFLNNNTHSVELKIYEYKLKFDLDTAQSPSSMQDFFNSSKMDNMVNTGGPLKLYKWGSVTPYTDVAAWTYLESSPEIKEMFNIFNVTTVYLKPGQSHKHSVWAPLRYGFNYITYGDNDTDRYRGNYGLFIIAKGLPAQLTASPNIAVFDASKVAVIQESKMAWRQRNAYKDRVFANITQPLVNSNIASTLIEKVEEHLPQEVPGI